MRDSQRAMFLAMLGYILIFLSAILYVILGTPPSVENSGIIIFLALAGVLYIVIFRFHPRVQHYMEAQHAFDRDYRYVKKDLIIIDEELETSSERAARQASQTGGC